MLLSFVPLGESCWSRLVAELGFAGGHGRSEIDALEMLHSRSKSAVEICSSYLTFVFFSSFRREYEKGRLDDDDDRGDEA